MILFANSRSKLKFVLLYVIESIVILSLGAILVTAFTRGGSFFTSPFIIKARNFKNPVLFLISALIFRKLLTRSFFHELILLTTFQRIVFGKFSQRITASPQFKRRVIWVLFILFLVTVLAAVSNHLQQGLTGHYYDNVEWSDPPILAARDRSIDLRRKYNTLYFRICQ